MQQTGALIIGWPFVYRPDCRLVVSTGSEALCGQTREQGKKERKPGYPGTNLPVLRLHTSVIPQGVGGHLEKYTETHTQTVNMIN